MPNDDNATASKPKPGARLLPAAARICGLALPLLAMVVAARPAHAMDKPDEIERRLDAARREANPRRPERVVVETRPAGRRYITQVNVKVAGRAANADWGMTRHGNATFAGALIYRSHILANDGKTVVEERAYTTMSTALVVTADRLSFDFLNPRAARDMLLGLLATESTPAALGARKALDWVFGEMGVQLTEKDIVFNERVVLDKRDGELFAALKLDGLSGKTVRITYRNDGVGGIEEIVPVDCVLLPEEEKLIRQGCYLFDAAFLDNGVRKVGDRWTVPAAVFGNLMNGVMEGEPTGRLQFVRRPDEKSPDAAGRPSDQVILAIDREGSGEIRFHQLNQRPDGATFDETGILRGLEGTARFVRAAGDAATGRPPEMYLYRLQAQGLAEVNLRSKNHLLFQARFETTPKLSVEYLSFPADIPVPLP